MHGDTAVTTAHRSGLGDWERAWQRPSRSLREHIDGYTGYRQRMAAPAVHRGIPGATLPLVLSFGPPQSIAVPGAPPVTVDSFLAGVHDQHVLIHAEGYHGIQVDLRPATAFLLLGRPLRELTSQTVPLDAVFGSEAGRLVDDVASAPDWPTRFRRLDRALARRLHDGRPGPDQEVLWAWNGLLRSGGRIPVGRLASELGWSQRHLAARFGEQLGLPPKRMARLLRFERTTALLARTRRAGLAEIAAEAGFYDQAHLTNEVRSFTGLSPTQLVDRRLPDEGGVFDLEDP